MFIWNDILLNKYRVLLKRLDIFSNFYILINFFFDFFLRNGYVIEYNLIVGK